MKRGPMRAVPNGIASSRGANRPNRQPSYRKGTHIEEGELRHRTYQKEVVAAQKTIAVDIPVSEVHVRVLRKLDRSGNQNESEVTGEAPE